MVGNCWFLTAVTTLLAYKKLFDQVVPPDQSFDGNDYRGIFRFRFWQNGEWIEICVDDRLPTTDNRMLFVTSTTKNEFWCALLEKAYAKLKGGYGNLQGGSFVEAITDLSGGISQYLEILPNHDLTDLQKTLTGHINERRVCSFVSCSINVQQKNLSFWRKSIDGKILTNGLITGHAYSVTLCKPIKLMNGGVEILVRVRNPWGNRVEWKGDWNDK